MKLKAVILTAAIALVGAASARADLTLQLGIIDANNNFVSEPDRTIFDLSSPVVFAGSVAGTGHIDSTSQSIQIGGATITDYFGFGGGDPDLASVPMDLNNGSFTTDDMFELSNLKPDSSGLISGIYTLVLDPNGTQVISQPFSVRLVPEPGTVALLASSLVGGSLLLVRRRRK
jgi:hypothetical protein